MSFIRTFRHSIVTILHWLTAYTNHGTMDPNQPTLMTSKMKDHQTNPKNRHALFSHRGNRQSIKELQKNIIRKKRQKCFVNCWKWWNDSHKMHSKLLSELNKITWPNRSEWMTGCWTSVHQPKNSWYVRETFPKWTISWRKTS